MKKRLIRGSALLATLLVLAGCAVGPDYQRPAAAPGCLQGSRPARLGSRQLENRRTRRASPARRMVEAVRRRGPEPAAGRSAARQPEPAGRRRPPDAGPRAATRGARRLLPQPGRRLRPLAPAPLGGVARPARRHADQPVDHLARPGQRGLRGRPVRPRFVNGRRRHRRRAAERSAVPLGAAGAAGRRRHHLLPGARAGRRGAALPPDSAAAHRGAATDPAPL